MADIRRTDITQPPGPRMSRCVVRVRHGLSVRPDRVGPPARTSRARPSRSSTASTAYLQGPGPASRTS